MKDSIYREVETPVGDFILKNAKGVTTKNGTYYHYSEVCELLNSFRRKLKTGKIA